MYLYALFGCKCLLFCLCHIDMKRQDYPKLTHRIPTKTSYSEGRKELSLLKSLSPWETIDNNFLLFPSPWIIFWDWNSKRKSVNVDGKLENNFNVFILMEALVPATTLPSKFCLSLTWWAVAGSTVNLDLQSMASVFCKKPTCFYLVEGRLSLILFLQQPGKLSHAWQ